MVPHTHRIMISKNTKYEKPMSMETTTGQIFT